VLAAAQHRWPEAVTELQQADRMRPNDSTIEYRLAQAYLHAGKKELAKQELARHDAAVKREQTTFDQRYQAIERFLVNIQ
jgi:predicted Zn-dependent protease